MRDYFMVIKDDRENREISEQTRRAERDAKALASAREANRGMAGPNMRHVVLDTNALMLVPQFRIDILTEVSRLVDTKYSFVITSRALWELDNLVKSKKRGFKAARLAHAYLKHIESKGMLETIKSDMKVDDWIVKYAAETPGAIVITNDILLKQRLRAQKTKVIGLRSKDHLDIM